MRKLILFIVLLCISFSVSFAGNLYIDTMGIAFPPRYGIVHVDDTTGILAPYTNINPTFPVAGITFRMDITNDDFPGADTLFSRTVQRNQLKPDSTAIINFGQLDYQMLNPGGRYHIFFSTTQEFDEDPTNNNFTYFFDIAAPFSRDSMITTFNNYLQLNYENSQLTNAAAYMGSGFDTHGTQFVTYDGEFEHTLAADSWFIMIDWDIYSKYEKPITYLFFDPIEREFTDFEVNWYPYIDGNLWNPSAFGSEFQIFGEPPPLITIPDLLDITPAAPLPKRDSVCAIIVTGKDSALQGALDFDRDWMEYMLRTNMLGEQLPEGNIQKLNHGTKAEIKAAIEKLKENYSKIYFLYTGHGSRSGKMCTNDGSTNWMTYDELFEDLYGTNATDITVVIDACYSGTAVPAASNNDKKEGKKVTVITSSDSTKTSKVGAYEETANPSNNWKQSFFTRLLVLCSIDSLANKNKDTIVSQQESFDWVREKNPTYRDSSINSWQNPQIFVEDNIVTIDVEALIAGFLKAYYESNPENTVIYYNPKEYNNSGYMYSTYEPELRLEFQAGSYLGWIDLNKYAKFEHSTLLFNYNVQLDTWDTLSANWYPTIETLDGKIEFTEDVVITGEEPEIYDTEEPVTVTEEVPSVPKDKVCALLISGQDKKSEKMQKSFEHDLELVKANLKSEKLGPQLDESNIRVEKGISADAICNILEEMKGKYTKVYFYYSGHGSKYDFMCTGDSLEEWLYYPTLMRKLSDVGADDYCIVIDACFSGLAKKALDSTSYFTDANVTLVTSSNDKKSSYTNFIGTTEKPLGFGLYTLNFLVCYGDPAAESDGVEGISFVEAFNWVKQRMPKSLSGKDLDSLQCPTITVKSNGTKQSEIKEVVFENIDLKMSNVDGAELEYDYSGVMKIDTKKFEATDKRIIEISGNRTWTLESSGINKDFSVDLEFQLRPQYEMLIPELPNIIGMVWRENNEDEWKPQYPSLHNKDDNTVLCGETNHFSDWAVGVITESNSSVDSKFLVGNVEYGPNPFKNLLNFEFKLDKPEVFSIEIVDITGTQMDFIGEHQYNSGNYNMNLDGSKYPSGTYYCRLVSSDGIRTIKLVKE